MRPRIRQSFDELVNHSNFTKVCHVLYLPCRTDHIDCVTLFFSTKSTTCILIYMYYVLHVGIGPCNFWKFLNPGLHDMLVSQSIEVNLRWAAFNRHIVVMYILILSFYSANKGRQTT